MRAPGPPVPFTEDHDTSGYFAAAERGAIAVLFCRACDGPLHLPRPYCAACGSWDVQWRDVAPLGHLYSWTVAEHQVHPGFPVPYTIVLVELDEVPGVRLVGHLPGARDLAMGMPMRATFDTVRDGAVVPMWEPMQKERT